MSTNVLHLCQALEYVAVKCIELDGENRNHKIRFTDEDCINALVIFNTVCGNRAINNLIDADIALRDGNQLMAHYGETLRETFVRVTGFDPHEYFKNLKSK